MQDDRFWGEVQQVPCIKCGSVGDLPRNVEYDEYVCSECEEDNDVN